jgi:glycosyltransferase involved in cell wall biosynthesis
MRCLHLFSDWKWTGPAPPVVSLCENLASLGVDVRLAFRAAPGDFAERTVGKEVEKVGVPHYDGFRLNRYFSLRDWTYDVRAIGEYVKREKIDILHTHLTHDHSEAALALFGRWSAPLLIRTDHKRDGLDPGQSMKILLRRTDGLLAYGKAIIDNDIRHFDYPVERTAVLPPGINPYSGPVQDLSDSLGIGPEEKVIGVIGRLKPDRGFDMILKGFRLLRDRMDRVKLVIVGRSSQIEESVKKPLQALGLESDVILAGYRLDDYFSMISTFHIFVMMRAGSDGTARALREVLAMGKPAIVSTRGMLPELVRDGVTGFVVSDEAQLADRMERMLCDDGLRTDMGIAATRTAVEEWNFAAQAQRLVRFYERMLSMGKRN